MVVSILILIFYTFTNDINHLITIQKHIIIISKQKQ